MRWKLDGPKTFVLVFQVALWSTVLYLGLDPAHRKARADAKVAAEERAAQKAALIRAENEFDRHAADIGMAIRALRRFDSSYGRGGGPPLERQWIEGNRKNYEKSLEYSRQWFREHYPKATGVLRLDSGY